MIERKVQVRNYGKMMLSVHHLDVITESVGFVFFPRSSSLEGWALNDRWLFFPMAFYRVFERNRMGGGGGNSRTFSFNVFIFAVTDTEDYRIIGCQKKRWMENADEITEI